MTLDQKGHSLVTFQSASKYQHNVISPAKEKAAHFSPYGTKAGNKDVAHKAEREDFIHAAFNSRRAKGENIRGPHSRGMMVLLASTQT